MKFKKTPLTIEFEASVEELDQLFTKLHPDFGLGVLWWIKKNFGLGLVRNQQMKGEND